MIKLFQMTTFFFAKTYILKSTGKNNFFPSKVLNTFYELPFLQLAHPAFLKGELALSALGVTCSSEVGWCTIIFKLVTIPLKICYQLFSAQKL